MTEILQMLDQAKTSHVKWRLNAERLIMGFDVEKDSAPVKPHDCQFGKWFYGEAKELLGYFESYRMTDASHRVMHAVYEAIYDLAQQGNAQLAKAKLIELVESSQTLIDAIGMLEQDAATISD